MTSFPLLQHGMAHLTSSLGSKRARFNFAGEGSAGRNNHVTVDVLTTNMRRNKSAEYVRPTDG